MKKRFNMRLRASRKQKTTLRRVLLLTSASVLSMSLGLILLINLGESGNAVAASDIEFQSKGSGNWSSADTWSKYHFGWSNALTAPTSSDNVISILKGHTVTVTKNVTVGRVLVKQGGILKIENGVTMTVTNASGSNSERAGTEKNIGRIIINGSGVIVYQNGEKERHNYSTTAVATSKTIW